ncbi:MAG: KaiC domain-containing protein [Aquificae bacterium]|nr:KaiC domain-containing protein [Aquificota bacterium]
MDKGFEKKPYGEEYFKPQVVKEAVWLGGEALKKAPKIEGVPSGIEGLDELFFKAEVDPQTGKVVKKPLGGIPKYAVINLTGVSDTGKSLMAEQFAVKRASEGEKVVFVTVESPAPFVVVGLKERATAMGLKFEEFENNLVIVDAASNHRLRNNLPDLLETLAFVYKTYKVKYTVIDSITGLYEAKEMMARQVVRQLFNFMKKWYQTAIFVSQKRSGHEELSAEAAGGYAVSHVVDCTFVVAKELVLTHYQAKLYGAEIGDLVRFFRIDGCRLCGHDTRLHLMEITEVGLVKIGPPLSEVRKRKYQKKEGT